MARQTREKVVRVLRCPKCWGTNIFYETAMITGRKYRCGDCGYMGALVVEEDVKVEEITEE